LLSYRHSGAQRLQQFLWTNVDMAYTTGTGIIPLCHNAAGTWQRIEVQPARRMSQLASASVRTQVATLVTTILAGTGKARWCELATSSPDAAATFLRVFPEARCICVHRACTDVIYDAAKAHPWSIAVPEFGSFAGTYPGNIVATLAAYWTSYTEELLDFEELQGNACLRVRYEDFVTDQGKIMDRILDFLAIDRSSAAGRDWMSPEEGETPSEAALPGCGAAVPVAEMPPGLRARIGQLHARLGYPALAGQ